MRIVLPFDLPPEIRFWLRVGIGADDACWPWLAGRDQDGAYGRAFDGKRTRPAQALAWEFANGCSVPKGLGVLHSCDNPPCCNPKHLRPGTPKDNTNDRVIRNRLIVPYRDYPVADDRRPTGDRNGARTHPEMVVRGQRASEIHWVARKLTEVEVLEMRRAYRGGASLAGLSRKFGVCAAQVHRIVNRQRWAWLREPPALKGVLQ